jgi:hypothetical protein
MYSLDPEISVKYALKEKNIQAVTESRRQILGTSSTYQNKGKNICNNMCPETFNLWFIT